MKRLFDFLVSSILVFILLPFFALIALLIRFKLGAPIIFKQIRPGIRGRSFTIYKFRSLTDEKDEKGNLLPDAKRFTRFSKMLRNSSLDELPELFNVLMGDMSLVGPRPLLPKYLERYDKEQARRHDVKPGITGWAQVNGRNAISWEEKFKLDLWYIDNHSLGLDLKIICLTVAQVFLQKDINQEGYVTAREFMGQKNEERKTR